MLRDNQTMRLALLLVAALFCAAELRAGAWMREPGESFGSSAVELRWPEGATTPSHYSSFYFERGVRPRLTLGLDVGITQTQDTTALVFARTPIRRGEGLQIAASLGLGQIADAPAARLGLSLGRGRENGWSGLDLMADLSEGGVTTKVDLTWGRSFAKGRKAMMQLHLHKPPDAGVAARLAPSFVMPLGQRFQLHTGISYGLGEAAGERGIKLGLWTKF